MHNYIIKIPDGPAYEVTQQKLDRYIASGEIPENALGRRSDSKEYLPIKDMLAWCAAHPEIQPQPLGQAGTLGDALTGSQSVVSRLRVIAGVIKFVWAAAGLLLGAAVGAALLGRDASAIGGVIGGIVGAAGGFLFGSLMAVFVDWSSEVLLLLDRIYVALNQTEKRLTSR